MSVRLFVLSGQQCKSMFSCVSRNPSRTVHLVRTSCTSRTERIAAGYAAPRRGGEPWNPDTPTTYYASTDDGAGGHGDVAADPGIRAVLARPRSTSSSGSRHAKRWTGTPPTSPATRTRSRRRDRSERRRPRGAAPIDTQVVDAWRPGGTAPGIHHLRQFCQTQREANHMRAHHSADVITLPADVGENYAKPIA